MADWMDGEVEADTHKLTNAQVGYVLRMTECLQDLIVVQSVGLIKEHIQNAQLDAAHQIWCELSEDEQTALWVAPTKGGIFTTEERNFIRGFTND